MLAEERRQRMVEMVAENATVSVTEFANLFDTSESTIRRDLDRLEAAGLLVKVHGGAASVETALTPAPFVAVEPTMAEKRDLHTPEKHVLAAWAAAQIQPDDFVYLDSGSTTQAIVEHLSDTACLATFVTNSVSLALALANRGARTIVIGGDVKAGTEAIVGPGALDALDAMLDGSRSAFETFLRIPLPARRRNIELDWKDYDDLGYLSGHSERAADQILLGAVSQRAAGAQRRGRRRARHDPGGSRL